jgi:hypothetical protein
MTAPQIHTSSTATAAPTIDLVTERYATPILSDSLTSLSQDWLSDATCRPPCWKGIVPGKTTADEAAAILKKIPFVAPETIKMGVSSLSSEGELNWGWRGRNVGLDGRAFFDGNTSNQPIHSLELLLPEKVFLRDVIAAYGEPTHLEARAAYDPSGRITSWLRVLYVNQGFGLAGEVPITIDSNMAFNSVFFFSPGMDSFTQLFPEYKSLPELIVPWQGPQSFEFYCRDEYDGKACRGEKQKTSSN